MTMYCNYSFNRNIILTYEVKQSGGISFKNNQTTKQFLKKYLDQKEVSKVLFLPFYWSK